MTQKNAVGELQFDGEEVWVGGCNLRAFLAELEGKKVILTVKLFDDYTGDSDHEHDDRIL